MKSCGFVSFRFVLSCEFVSLICCVEFLKKAASRRVLASFEALEEADWPP